MDDNDTTRDADHRAARARSTGHRNHPAKNEGAGEAAAGAPSESQRIAEAIQIARRRLAAGWTEKYLLGWNEQGYWRDSCDGGPAVTAMVAVALSFIGRLDTKTAGKIRGYLESPQFRVPPRGPTTSLNSGFPSYVGGKFGDLGSTAACYAGLIATGARDDDRRAAEAWRYIEEHGGEEAVIALARAGDLAALALAMVDRLRAPLPKAPLLFGLAPGAEYLLEQRFGYLLPFRCLVSDVIAAHREDRGSANRPRPPRVTGGAPRSARELSEMMIRHFDAAADGVTTTAASLARSGADAAAGVMKSTARSLVGMAQGGLTTAAGIADAVRLGPLRLFEAAARGALETGQAAVSGALHAAETVGRLKPAMRQASGGVLRQIEAWRCQLYLQRFRNDDGSWLYGDSVHTALALAAYHALGYSMSDPTLSESIDWLKSDRILVERKVEKQTIAYFNVFYTDIWPTSFVLRALIESGTPVADPAMTRAINWLIAVQRSGSWAFQATNNTTPDLDDTAVAMATLAIARDRLRASEGPNGARVDPDLAPREQERLPARCDAAIDAARVFLLSRQNADGGWASYQPHLPGKPRGAIMTKDPDASNVVDLASQLKVVVNPPPELGDPATEDVTGRVLFGLGRAGSRSDDPAVMKAVQFLIDQQDTNHGWWGRWVVNYIASTAWVLRGLAAVKVDRKTPFIRNAIQFLLKARRDDGGWADTVESYRAPGLLPSAEAPSNPCLTGLVVCALIEMGEASLPEVASGIDFILTHGARTEDTLHCLFPPALFYTLPLTELQLPLEALGLFARHKRSVAASTASLAAYPTGGGEGMEGGDASGGGDANDPLEPLVRSLTKEQIRQMKSDGDILADALIDAIFKEHSAITAPSERINAIFQTLGTLADSDPETVSGVSTTLGKRAGDFLEALPALQVDAGRLESARGLFQTAGFGVPLVLFCSSLPQCFAVPSGAKVLLSSGRLATNPRRRLVETAQLVFDVLAPGGLTAATSGEVRAALAAGRQPTGRGLRTARKVRLMHAAVRKLVRESRSGSAEMPISQFDLIGTLMSFSVLVTDGLRALGLTVTDKQADDWFHVWLAVGQVLGVQIPSGVSLQTAADGADFFDHVRQEWAPSDEGSALARGTLDLMTDLLPGEELDGVGATLVRHLAGERCGDILGIDPTDWTKILVERSPLVTTILGNVVGRVFETPLTPLLQQAAFGIMEALADREREDKGVPFSISPELLNAWRNQFHGRFRSS